MSNFDGLPENVKRRLVGALNLANKAKNPNEAATAAGMVQNMLLKYNITLQDVDENFIAKPSDIEFKGMVKKHIVFSGSNRDKNMGNLINVLSKYMFAKSIWTYLRTNTDFNVNAMAVMGLEINVDMVIQLYDKLRFSLNKAVDMAFSEYKRRGGTVHGKGWKSDWIYGAVIGIGVQMSENYERFRNSQFLLDGEIATPDVGFGTPVVPGTAIIISRENQLQKYYENQFPERSNFGTSKKRVNSIAYNSGYNYGKNMEIHSRVK